MSKKIPTQMNFSSQNFLDQDFLEEKKLLTKNSAAIIRTPCLVSCKVYNIACVVVTSL